MQVTVLGKYGPFPAPGGATSSYLVEEGDTTLLLDIGSGTFNRLIGRMDLNRINALLVSHLHQDHISDASILRYAMEAGLRKEPLPVYLPVEPRDVREKFAHAVFNMSDLQNRRRVQIGSLSVTFHRMAHPMPAFAMDIQNAEGKRLFYTADTAWFPMLPELVRGADLVIADACLSERDRKGKPLAHMTAREVGTLMIAADLKRVLLTHLRGNADESVILREVAADGAELIKELETYTI